MTKISGKIVVFLAIVVLVIVASGAFFTWEYGDDYLNMVKMRGFGLLEYIWHLYLKWDGRILSPAGLFLIIFLKIGSAPFAVFSYMVVYAICIIIAARIIALWWNLERISQMDLVSLLAVFFIGTWPLFKDVVYWLTGGYYSIFLLQGLIVFWWYSKQALLRDAEHTFSLVKGLAVLLLSLNTQNLLMPLACIMGLHTCYTWWRGDKKTAYLLTFQYLLPVFFGLLVVSLAPGNWARIQAEKSTASEHVGFSLTATLNMLLRFAVYAKWAVVAGFVFGFGFVNRKQAWPIRTVFLIIAGSVFLAVLSLSPFLLTPFLARIRVYYFGTLFLMVGSIPVGAYARQLINSFAPALGNWRYVPVMLFFFYGIIFFTDQLRLMIPFSKEVAVRKQFLESKTKSTEVVHYKRLTMPENLHLIRWADYRRYGNWDQVQEYYQLGGYVEDVPASGY